VAGFGSQHQLREAMWLVSQFQKRMRTEHPQTVFLQDLEGKLCAELSVRDILRSLAKGIQEDNLPDSDSALLAAIGQRLFVPITDSAREVPATLSSSAPRQVVGHF